MDALTPAHHDRAGTGKTQIGDRGLSAEIDASRAFDELLAVRSPDVARHGVELLDAGYADVGELVDPAALVAERRRRDAGNDDASVGHRLAARTGEPHADRARALLADGAEMHREAIRSHHQRGHLEISLSSRGRSYPASSGA